MQHYRNYSHFLLGFDICLSWKQNSVGAHQILLCAGRVLSDRENRENREKSGNLVGREKSGKSQGICCLDREKIIKAFYSSNRYPVYLTYDVILCSCCIYVIVHISFHLF